MTKVTCAFAEARISKENSVLTVMVYKCFYRVGWLYRGSPHAGELSVGEQRGGFQWLTPHAADPYTFLVVVCRSCYWNRVLCSTVCKTIVIPSNQEEMQERGKKARHQLSKVVGK